MTDSHGVERHNTFFWTAALGIVLVLGGAFWLHDASSCEISRAHEEVRQRYLAAANTLERVRSTGADQSAVAQQAQRSLALIDPMPRSFILAELTNALPVGTVLTHIEIGRSGTVRLAGTTGQPPQVDLLLQRLGEGRYFRDITLTEQSSDRFRVELKIYLAGTDKGVRS